MSITTAVNVNYSMSAYSSTKSYFLSRGAGETYANYMTALIIRIANYLGVTPQLLLESSEVARRFSMTHSSYKLANSSNNTSSQLGIVTPVSNRYSLQARAIRS